MLRLGALVRLADLRVSQGPFEEAEQLLDGIDVDIDLEAARPWAAIHLAGGDTSLAAHVLAGYDFSTQLATLESPPPEIQQLLGAVNGDSEAMDDFVSVVVGTLSPVEFFDPWNVGRLLNVVHA